jgi:uncharacterized protein YjbI with pentapeptide repeats
MTRVTGRARTLAEMHFAASLQPCPHCGSKDAVELALVARGESWTFGGACPSCTRRRTFTFSIHGDPLLGRHAVRHLGDERPSEVIRPGQFIAELDHLLPLIRSDPRVLSARDWYASRRALIRALTCVIELCKFVPGGEAHIPADRLTVDEQRDQKARPERYASAWIAAQQRGLTMILGRYLADTPRIDQIEQAAGLFKPPVGAIDSESLRAHAAWLRAGRSGPGRLDVVGYRSPHVRLAGSSLVGARLSDVTLDRLNLGGIHLEDAELRDVSMLGASLVNAVFRNARLDRAFLVRANMTLAVFDNASLHETDLQHAELDRSSWRGMTATEGRFDDARFGNANLDGSRFVRSTFCRADFRPRSARITASTRAVFEDCDLRGTSWHGRDLTGASFVRCSFAGTLGKPLGCELVTIVDPDLSFEGDGSFIGTADDILEGWC